MAKVTQSKVSLFVMPNGRSAGRGTGLSPLSIDRHGMTGKADNTIPGRGQDYGYDEYGRIRIKNTFQEAPGGLGTATLEFERDTSVDYVEKRKADQRHFDVWEMSVPCGLRNNPFGWLSGGRLDFYGDCSVTVYNPGDAPARDGSDAPVVNSATLAFAYHFILQPLTIDDVTPEIAANQQQLNGIVGLVEPLVPGCFPGYNGPDQHLFAFGNAPAAGNASVFYSIDGGGTWAAITAQPFGADEHITAGAVRLVNTNGCRLVVGNGVGTANLQVAYADIVFGDEVNATWTVVDLNATAADYVSAIAWTSFDALYVAGGTAGDDIYVSTDRGATFTEVFTGAGEQINDMAKGAGQDCNDVYAVGDTNTILIRRGGSGGFGALVGPSGGGDFHSIAIDNLGRLIAGNGTSLYISENGAANAGGWTLLNNFGTSKLVVDVFMPKGDSNHLYAVVDDSTPGNGTFWHSNDAGGNWNQVTVRTNGGYNAGYQSTEDPNLFYVVGDVSTTYGRIHKILASVSGC